MSSTSSLKILAIGDQHFENKNELETRQMCDKIYEIVLTEKPDVVVALGDALHTHEVVNINPLKRAIQFFHRLSQLTSHLYIIVGNHDRPNNTAFLTDDSPFIACKQWSNTTVVDKVVVNNGLVFVPYVPPGRFLEALTTEGITEENIASYRLIFAHQEFKGSKMGAITSVHGDEWKGSYPLCISGHIHEYQQPYHNLIYPGTPIQLGYGVPPSKGVMLINIEEDSISHSFVDLGLPRKLIVHLTPEQLSSYTLPENTFVKLVCKGDTKVIREIIKLDSVKDMLKSPRVKLSIQEERKSKPEHFSVKTETVAFQRRLTQVIEKQSSEVKILFSSLFGEV